MDSTVVIAVTIAGSSGLVAMTALILVYHGFASIHGRFATLESRMLTSENVSTALETDWHF